LENGGERMHPHAPAGQVDRPHTGLTNNQATGSVRPNFAVIFFAIAALCAKGCQPTSRKRNDNIQKGIEEARQMRKTRAVRLAR